MTLLSKNIQSVNHYYKLKRLLQIFSFSNFMLLCVCNIYSQVLQEWNVRKSNGFSKSMEIDSFGNIYVGGNQGNETVIDFCLIKYSPSGNLQWATYYNGSANGYDFGNTIKLDNDGNIIITGSSEGVGTLVDCATIKYSSSGEQIWVARYNSVENQNDVSYALTVDKKCNIYITGSSQNTFGGRECITIKYDSTGIQNWISKYNRGTKSFNEGASITLDDSENVYVTGISNGDFITIKYNDIGTQQWVVFYNSLMNDNDGAESVRVDKIGNVYVSGSSVGAMFYYDYATVKYNSEGEEQWVRRYEGSSHYMDQLRSMEIDSSGNVFVTGNSTESGHGYDFTTIKYNTNGDTLWKTSYNNGLNDIAFAIALDNFGNVYVTGESDGNGTNEDYATVKYNSSGVLQWVKRYDYSGQFGDIPNAIAVDNSGNIFVTGSSNRDILTIKYSQPTGVNPFSFENPSVFKLEQNYPNPFNPITNINFSLPNNKFVILKIYDILGSEVNRIINERKNAGTYSVQFNGNDLPSGIYFYSLLLDGKVADTKRMVLLK